MLKLRSFIRYWLPVVLLMALIFGASTDHGSFQRSSRILEPLLRWLFPGMSEDAIYNFVFAVRKCAHFCEYATLALLAWRARRKPVRSDARRWEWPPAVEALWLAMLYAATDEFHQTFVPSREGCVRDVLIDTTGAAAALGLLWLVGRWRRSGVARATCP